MRRAGLTIALFAAVAIVATPAVAQRTPRDGRDRAPASSEADSPDPVKRTWDFAKRFGIAHFDPRDCASDPERLAAELDAYNARVDRFLAGPSDPKKLGLERRSYVKQVLGTTRDIATLRETFAATGLRSPDSDVPPVDRDICRAEAQRHQLQAIAAGLRAMARVYPDMAEIGPPLAEAEAVLAQMGDTGALRRQVLANRAAALAEVRMKPPLARNPAWEQGLRDGFARLVPGETILRLHLYSADWYVHRNEFTGVPEYRQVGAWVATRREDGSCWITGIDLWQSFTGGSFDAGEYRLGQAPRPILCENLPR
ncbi:hypothetical protein [Porphyrobacter sp. YT40]|uniref:hypothetical protein n=1 Tax=Porphyrobacter sp. YT40 TaxID=2547601 RepID=UPI001141BF91|nr:hypothetical protein [Porphyrobacter sp. YT40]QDH35741.1 hypothetical protein E2E27_16330 [Porphyrobacter sp. YT40]